MKPELIPRPLWLQRPARGFSEQPRPMFLGTLFQFLQRKALYTFSLSLHTHSLHICLISSYILRLQYSKWGDGNGNTPVAVKNDSWQGAKNRTTLQKRHRDSRNKEIHMLQFVQSLMAVVVHLSLPAHPQKRSITFHIFKVKGAASFHLMGKDLLCACHCR